MIMKAIISCVIIFGLRIRKTLRACQKIREFKRSSFLTLFVNFQVQKMKNTDISCGEKIFFFTQVNPIDNTEKG